MKCELCHKVDAEVAVHIEQGGRDQELYVCKGCATHAPGADKAGAKGSAAPRDLTPLEQAELGTLMGVVLDAALEFAGGLTGGDGGTRDPVCPGCGISRAEYRRRSRLGCPVCYETFARDLDAVIRDMHRANEHVGKVPASESTAVTRRRLEEALKKAVAAQDFTGAARLYEHLQALDGKGGTHGG